MRSADQSTILRILLVLFVIYLIIIKYPATISIILLAVAFLLDGVDGYLALRETSKGKITLSMYINYSLGDKTNAKQIKAFKESTAKTAKYGPRFDVAADRIAEYSFWALFTVLNIVPFFVLIIVIIRHSLADAFLGSKGTSSKMKTGIASKLYSSNISRGAINVLKFVTFAYLILVYVASYPIVPGYILIALLVLFIVARGAAEIYESLKS
ncbi:MAG: CDP-alcohol phosphatidyltransferase family protein [Candidatus Micrarchaeaceae archaeon]